MRKQFSILFLLLCLGFNAEAQMLTLKVVEPEMRKEGLIVVDMQFDRFTLDDKGEYAYDSDKVTKKERVYVSIGSYGFITILEPKKKMQMTITGKGKYAKAKYKGPNALEAETLNAIDNFYTTKDAYYEEKNPQDTIAYDEAWRLLDEHYADICRLLKKEKDAAKRAAMQTEADMRYLANRIHMQGGYCYKYGLDNKTDRFYSSLMAQVDPNDDKFTYHGIINDYIYYKMPVAVDRNLDVTTYACEYLKTVVREVQNPEIRYNMLEMHVSQCVQAEELDVDKFWNLVQEKCDKSIVDKYQYIVDAKHSTRSGMKCPDVTFSDINNQSHALSEFFGKVLYIDLWATWCGPCCMEIPYLEKLVEHYKDDPRILFISISSDRDHKAWEKKIEEDKPEWPQFITSREEDKLLSSQWGVASIPRFLIINADGTINNNDAFRPSDDHAIEKIDAILNVQKGM